MDNCVPVLGAVSSPYIRTVHTNVTVPSQSRLWISVPVQYASVEIRGVEGDVRIR